MSDMDRGRITGYPEAITDELPTTIELGFGVSSNGYEQVRNMNWEKGRHSPISAACVAARIWRALNPEARSLGLLAMELKRR